MIVRIYTGDDGETHFADVDIPAGGDPVSMALKEGADIRFTHTGENRFSDWHNAPRRQFVITLSGGMEVGIGDGTVRSFGPGDVLLAEDLTGRGHTTRTIAPRLGAVVPLPD